MKERLFKINLIGEGEVKARTREEAERIAAEDGFKLLRLDPRRTHELIGHNLLINVGGIMGSIICIGFLISWSNLIVLMQTIDQPLRTFGILLVLIFMIVSLKLPKIINEFFHHEGNLGDHNFGRIKR